MAIEYIPRQPVYFGDPESDCFCESTPYSQLVKLGDITQFQMRLNNCFDTETIITNGSFTTNSDWSTTGTGWAISGGVATHAAGVAGAIYQDTPVAGKYYNIEFTVSGITNGVLTVNMPSVMADAPFTVDITSNGVYSYWGLCGDYGRLSFYADADFDGSIDDVAAYELDTNFKVVIKDSNDDFVARITYTDDPDYFVLDQDTLTVSIDWDTLQVPTNGCYYLCFIDPCINTNSQNEVERNTNDFSSNADWIEEIDSPSEYFKIDSGTGRYSNVGDDMTLSYSGYTFIVGVNYSITYTISSINNAKCRLNIGGSVGATQTTNGTYTEVLYADGTQLDILGIYDGSFGAFGGFRIDNLIIDIAEYTCNLTSNTFTIGNYDCTLRINACNDEDGLGFRFTDSNFSPVIRLEAAFFMGAYPSERKYQIESNGNKKLNYFSGRKNRKLHIEPVPEYIHDFLSLLSGFDRFYIGDTAYFVEDDEYQPIVNNEDPTLAGVIIEMSEKLQLKQNLNIGNTETNCAIGENFLIDENDNFIMNGLDGGLILIN